MGLSHLDNRISMHHSLIDRFRGAILGAVMGEILGVNCQQPQAWRDVEHWGCCPPVEPSPWGKLAIGQAQALIGERTKPLILPIEDESVMIALLPIALFYHEDLTLLNFHLEAALGCASAQVLERCLHGEATPWGYLGEIALTLQEKSAPILDFRLTLLQAAKMPHPHVNCAIAGALAGAAHSLTGIPPSWRQRFNQAGYASFWGLTSEVELLQIADDLFAAWSGVYHPTQRLGKPHGGGSPNDSPLADSGFGRGLIKFCKMFAG